MSRGAPSSTQKRPRWRGTEAAGVGYAPWNWSSGCKPDDHNLAAMAMEAS